MKLPIIAGIVFKIGNDDNISHLSKGKTALAFSKRINCHHEKGQD
jgi:hypothetical protein